MITAILPFRSIADSKRRMESAVDEQERMELSARLLVRTLAALRAARSISRTIVVTPDPMARALAQTAGADAIDDRGAELNEAIRLGLDRATRDGASTALIVPVDLAHVSAAEIDAVPQLSGHGFEIVRYREERGRFESLRQLDEVPGLAGKCDGAEAEVCGYEEVRLFLVDEVPFWAGPGGGDVLDAVGDGVCEEE